MSGRLVLDQTKPWAERKKEISIPKGKHLSLKSQSLSLCIDAKQSMSYKKGISLD